MDKFYQSHWLEIEKSRLERYEQMFQWRPESEPLLEPLELKDGMNVLDYGCGPGYLSAEIARRVGIGGRVTGLDINEEFVNRAKARAKEEGLAQLEFQVLKEGSWPLEPDSIDRVICKNVLEYVPDVTEVLHEAQRVLKPGGMLEIIDSDWGFVVVEPWGKDRTEFFFAAASGAFKEPHIGRKLTGLLASAGYSNVHPQVNSMVDTQGRAFNVLVNMALYINDLETMDKEYVAALMDELNSAVEKGEYLFVLPQFLITATKGG